jgi:hypothetical protein
MLVTSWKRPPPANSRVLDLRSADITEPGFHLSKALIPSLRDEPSGSPDKIAILLEETPHSFKKDIDTEASSSSPRFPKPKYPAMSTSNSRRRGELPIN